MTQRYWQVILKRLMLMAAEQMVKGSRWVDLVTGEADVGDIHTWAMFRPDA